MGTAVVSRDIPLILPQEHEMFCCLVSQGVSVRQSSIRAGYSSDYGQDLMMRPEIRQRIKTLVSEPEEAIKVGVITELQVLRNRAANEGHDADVRAEVALRLQLLMAQAKLAGMIVERKQVQKRSVSFTAAVGNKEELNKLLAEQLQALSPGGRRKLELIAAGADDDVIEAG